MSFPINIVTLKALEAKGLVVFSTPIKYGSYTLQPVKVASDFDYDKASISRELYENVPRSLTLLEKDGVLIKIFYGLPKFDSYENGKNGTIQDIKDSIDSSHECVLEVNQKHNGEAFTVGAILDDGIVTYYVSSKNVPILIKDRNDLETYVGLRYVEVRSGALQFLDILENLSEQEIIGLNEILLIHTLAIEKINPEFSHIAVEDKKLWILQVRNTESGLVNNSPDILSALDSYGLPRAKEFTNQVLHSMVNDVYSVYDRLPDTHDKPSKSDFITVLELLESKIVTVTSGSNIDIYIRIITYVSLQVLQARHMDITSSELLDIACGNYSKFELTEGNICKTYDTVKQRMLLVKTKVALYYLIRSCRTIVERYTHLAAITNVSITSSSTQYWMNYLTPKWKSAWSTVLYHVAGFVSSPLFLKYIKDKCNRGRIDSPDFFQAVKEYIINPNLEIVEPIIILTTKADLSTVEEILTEASIKYTVSDSQKDIKNRLTNTVTVMVNQKTSNFTDFKGTLIKFTLLEPLTKDQIKCASGPEKMMNAFTNDLVFIDIKKEIRDESCCKTANDLVERMTNDKKVIKEVIRQPTSYYKLQYFDHDFEDYRPVLPSLMKTMTSIDLHNPFSSKTVLPCHEEFVSELTKLPLMKRNDKIIDQLHEIIKKEYTGSTLVVFLTGLPGLGKDFLAESVAKISDLDIGIINQDQYNGEADPYLSGLKQMLNPNPEQMLKTKKIIIITRNGPGSKRSLELAYQVNAKICLISPGDEPVKLFLGASRYALDRKMQDKEHSLSKQSCEEIILIISKFFSALGAAELEILNISKKYLAIVISKTEHVTLEYGNITQVELIDQIVDLETDKLVTIKNEKYELQFYTVSKTSIEFKKKNLHITAKRNNAYPVHSGWWCEVLPYITDMVTIESVVRNCTGKIDAVY